MKRSLVSLSILLFITVGFMGNTQPCADPGNIYSFTYDGTTYEVVKEMKSWEEAAACAVERGGYLVQINDQGEQDAVYDAIVNGAAVPSNYTVVPDGGGIAYVWIGATDKETEGVWLWDGNDDGTGENFWNGEGAAGGGGGSAVGGAFVNWGGASTGTYKEPDDFGSGQDAAAIGLAGWPSGSGSLGIAGEWNDIRLTNTIYFVIEIDNTSLIEKDNNPLKIYPNPARDQLTIQMNQTNRLIGTVSLFNIQGVQILLETNLASHKVIMNTISIPSGFYLLTIRMNNGDETMHRLEILH